MNDRMTIGQASRRAGLPVRTIRFYSDAGLLPESDRTEAGYRLYSESDLLRLELIATLREAGLDLATVGAVLARDLSLADALRLRLSAVEAHVVSLQHVAAAIRAALRSGPTEDDLRRLHAVTRLSNEERKAVIERFFAEVSEGIPIDQDWLRQMIEASAPKMPEEPTKEQLDAWIELSEIVSDSSFIQAMRATASESWDGQFDHEAYRNGSNDVVQEARAAIDAGLEPGSDRGAGIANKLVEVTAAASGKPVDASMRSELHRRFSEHDRRASRYWVLVGIINGTPHTTGPIEEWDWIADAVKAHLA